MELMRESCVPTNAGMPALPEAEARELLARLPSWRLVQGGRGIARRVTFVDFKHAMSFVHRMADIAEVEGHHPDFAVHLKNVDVELTTKDIGGLSRNDFILAAKIENIAERIVERIAHSGTWPRVSERS